MAKRKKKRSPRGLGSFRVRDNGSVEYRISFKDEFGKTKRRSFTSMSEAEGLEKYEEFKDKQEKLSRGIAVDATIPELLKARYRRDYELNFTNEQGYSRSMETLKIIANSEIGSIPIAYVTKQQLLLFLTSLTCYSNSIIEKVFLLLKKGFQEAVNKDIITKNLMLDGDIRRPKSNKPDKKVRAFTTKEQKTFVDAVNAHHVPYGRNNYKLQVLIELYTGLRMGEINALKPGDIDFDRRIIMVRRTISSGNSKRPFINNTTKTYAGNRDVPITNDAEKILREAIDMMKPNPDGLIFYDHNKMSLVTTNQVNCFFKRICKKAGLDVAGQHSLRHTFATRCIESEIDAFVLKSWLGHTDIHVTLDTYADVFEILNNKSIQKLQEYTNKI